MNYNQRSSLFVLRSGRLGMHIPEFGQSSYNLQHYDTTFRCTFPLLFASLCLVSGSQKHAEQVAVLIRRCHAVREFSEDPQLCYLLASCLVPHHRAIPPPGFAPLCCCNQLCLLLRYGDMCGGLPPVECCESTNKSSCKFSHCGPKVGEEVQD